MKRLQIEPEQWLELSMGFESAFKGYAGSSYTLRKAYSNLGYQRTPNIAKADQLLQ